MLTDGLISPNNADDEKETQREVNSTIRKRDAEASNLNAHTKLVSPFSLEFAERLNYSWTPLSRVPRDENCVTEFLKWELEPARHVEFMRKDCYRRV